MAKFKVIDPKGFHLGGKLHPKGETFEGQTKNAHVCTGLHFKQIEAVTEKAPADPPAKKEKAPADPPA